MPVVWSEELIAKVTELLAVGHSRRTAAESLGLNRAALTSAINRLPALAQFRMSPEQQRKEQRARQAEYERTRYAKRRAEKALAPPKPKPAPVVSSRPAPDPDSPPADPKALVDIGVGECKFPVAERPDVIGGYLFCASSTPSVTDSYCAAHQRRMFTSPQAVRR